MADSLSRSSGTMGTLPVFMTAISTILGAILFLRFGYAVAHVGLIGALAIIVIGHLVTIPTALAVAEIATNHKVEGGGAYYMISRSFGLNIGASIGIALFLSQAISVAFYVIAFAVAFEPVSDWLMMTYNIPLPPDMAKRVVGLVFMALLSVLMLTKGANIGVKALYLVVAVLFVALAFFFMGKPYSMHSHSFTATVYSSDPFFYVFTIIFPAFTGIAAGLGLSGDLKDPKKSIPQGTIWATVIGILVYIAVCFKLFYSASLKDLAANNGESIMENISLWGPIIPIGLACAAISSALGSVMIAPRTLQALGVDRIFPERMSSWFATGKNKTNEPLNSTIVTCLIAFFFVAIGDIDFVARIISMFFMVTYGAICMISFLEHFAADPAYRPTFKSRWYFSLFGAILCLGLMFAMDAGYAILSLVIMVLIYFWASRGEDQRGLVKLFKGVIFQASRELQVYMQKNDSEDDDESWRPFIICITKDTFVRSSALDQVRWLSHRYGFGTYIHFIEGFLSKETYKEAAEYKERLLKLVEGAKSKVYIDTIISPSYTSAIAQSIQLSGVSGRGNNLILFEFSKTEPETLKNVTDNFKLLRATDFDVTILRSSYKGFRNKQEIHIWISSQDYENSNLMILLAYIMLGHPEWKNGVIKIFSLYQSGGIEEQKDRLLSLIRSGRLPISPTNVNLLELTDESEIKDIINKKSVDADLTILGFRGDVMLEDSDEIFSGYDELGNILFVSALKEKDIS